jgi:hypothetical protein
VDLSQSSVAEEPQLQMELVNHLIDNLDMEAAAQWAVRCHMPVELLPHQVVSLLQSEQW